MNRNTRNCIMLLALLLAACNKKEVISPAPADAAVNFYSASEVLLTSSTYINKYIYVDTYDTTTTFHPYFYNDLIEYPIAWGLAKGNIPFISYMRLAAGAHGFWFTNAARLVAADTSLAFAPGEYRQLYLCDDLPLADGTPAYKVVAVQEDRRTDTARVRIRILHMSPDTGPLHAYLQGADGRRMFEGLPQEVVYGHATPYAAVDTVNARREKLQLRLFAGTDTANAVVSAALPATPGAAYIVIVRGFSANRVIRSPAGTKADGSLQYETLSIPANVRVELRQSH